ncbi:alpha/beta hydrolase [Puia dinghuensis]|nr:alpha/beta fold hydrolase [Puia dinghuensis]
MKIPQKLALPYTRARINILSLASPRKAAIKAFRLFCTPQQRVTKKGSAFFQQGQPLSFRYNNHTVRGRHWPSVEPSKKKVLIAHGFESASPNFEGYVAALVQKGYEVVAFDAPAHGASGGSRILLPDYVNVLRTIEQNHGPFHSYLGHSLGGLALALFLENSPHNKVTRLVLVAPAVETTLAVDNFARLLRLSPEVVREMDDYVQETSGHHFAWYSLRRAFHHISADTLYVQDEADRVTPFKDALLVQKDGHSNIRFIFTKGLGHRKVYKDETVMHRIVGFL